jgi:hypothetical protein
MIRMTETKLADLIGLTEIAEMYSVTKNVASGWTRKDTFPPPAVQLRMGPAWDRKKVIEWRQKDPTLEHEYHVSCVHCGSDADDGLLAWELIERDVTGRDIRAILSVTCPTCSEKTFIDIGRSGVKQGTSIKVKKEEPK